MRIALIVLTLSILLSSCATPAVVVGGLVGGAAVYEWQKHHSHCWRDYRGLWHPCKRVYTQHR